jgi:hypothetical protein
MRVIPPARARIAQDAVLGALFSLLEAASDNASRPDAAERIEQVAELCADGAKLAYVIGLLGRRSMVPPRAAS